MSATTTTTTTTMDMDAIRAALAGVYEIDPEPLGRGASSVVLRARVLDKSISNNNSPNNDNDVVALKVVTKAGLSARMESAVLREALLLGSLRHAHVVRLADFHDAGGHLVIATELVAGGELFHRLVAAGAFHEAAARLVVRCVASALRYLHADRGIVHRDIKLENLLVVPYVPGGPEDRGDPSGGLGIASIKLCDFGLAKVVFDTATQTPCGTVEYSAPEIFRDEAYSKSVDLWALGCVLYTLLCGFPPFFGDSPSHVAAKVRAGAFAFLSPWWDTVSFEAKDLVRRLLDTDPSRRIDVRELLRHPWLVGAAMSPARIQQCILDHHRIATSHIPSNRCVMQQQQPRRRIHSHVPAPAIQALAPPVNPSLIPLPAHVQIQIPDHVPAPSPIASQARYCMPAVAPPRRRAVVAATTNTSSSSLFNTRTARYSSALAANPIYTSSSNISNSLIGGDSAWPDLNDHILATPMEPSPIVNFDTLPMRAPCSAAAAAGPYSASPSSQYVLHYQDARSDYLTGNSFDMQTQICSPIPLPDLVDAPMSAVGSLSANMMLPPLPPPSAHNPALSFSLSLLPSEYEFNRSVMADTSPHSAYPQMQSSTLPMSNAELAMSPSYYRSDMNDPIAEREHVSLRPVMSPSAPHNSPVTGLGIGGFQSMLTQPFTYRSRAAAAEAPLPLPPPPPPSRSSSMTADVTVTNDSSKPVLSHTLPIPIPVTTSSDVPSTAMDAPSDISSSADMEESSHAASAAAVTAAAIISLSIASSLSTSSSSSSTMSQLSPMPEISPALMTPRPLILTRDMANAPIRVYQDMITGSVVGNTSANEYGEDPLSAPRSSTMLPSGTSALIPSAPHPSPRVLGASRSRIPVPSSPKVSTSTENAPSVNSPLKHSSVFAFDSRAIANVGLPPPAALLVRMGSLRHRQQMDTDQQQLNSPVGHPPQPTTPTLSMGKSSIPHRPRPPTWTKSQVITTATASIPSTSAQCSLSASSQPTVRLGFNLDMSSSSLLLRRRRKKSESNLQSITDASNAGSSTSVNESTTTTTEMNTGLSTTSLKSPHALPKVTLDPGEDTVSDTTLHPSSSHVSVFPITARSSGSLCSPSALSPHGSGQPPIAMKCQ